MIRHTSACLSVLVLLVLSATTTPAAEDTTLRFDRETHAIINLRRGDQTRQQWQKDTEEMFFDAVHRFLLLRFPGCAEAIHAKLQEGYRIGSARLTMRWTQQEFRRVAGYPWRGYAVKGKEPPAWHADAYLLGRPWEDDEKLGPTWNAHLNGAGYWARGGARETDSDRSLNPLDTTELSEKSADGAIDVTAALTSPRFGKTTAQRLRRLESSGFLLQKRELNDYELGQKGLPTGVCRIWIEDPVLEVTFEKAAGADPGTLPPPVAIAQRAEELKKSGRGGVPTSRIPANLRELTQSVTARPADMPEWMWKRVEEVRHLRTRRHPPAQYAPPAWTLQNKLESGDEAAYREAIDTMLGHPPGWFMGHSHINFMMPLLRSRSLLPGSARHQIRQFFATRWVPPYKEDLFHHRVGYFSKMGTLNHQSQCRAEAILAGEMLGLDDLWVHGRRGLSLMNRQMIFGEGACQEHGDTFYLGITLTPLQTVAKYSVDPLTRLKAELAVEKLLFEAIGTYHPGLRRRVSSVSRRYRVEDLIMGQDVLRAALHMLSREGVLMQADRLKVHDLFTTNFASVQPSWVAGVAPWGRAWESNSIDEKSLPAEFVAATRIRGWLEEPLYHTTYLGRSYGLASLTGNVPKEWPVVACWKRTAGRAQTLDDLGIVFPWGYLNDRPSSWIGQHKPAGRPANPLLGVLQHENTMIYVMQPRERTFLEELAELEGIRSICSRFSIYTYGEGHAPKVWINGARATEFPLTAGAGDVIALRDGVSYMALVPLPTTDLGRKEQVVIRREHPRMTISSYIMDREEPLHPDEAMWNKLADATTGWIVEMGDEAEYGSFEKFRRHVGAGQLKTRWDAAERNLHVSWTGGEDTLELGHHTGHVRDHVQNYVVPSATLRYQRVNGRWPWPAKGIDLDCPQGQLGTAERLEKGGAVLETVEGQPALLRVEPTSGRYEAVNPFIDPTPLRFRLPGGMTIRSEGPIGLCRINARPEQNHLTVDYHLPPPAGDTGVELLKADAEAGQHAGVYEVEPLTRKFFRPGMDIEGARGNSARTLLIRSEQGPPTVTLNGDPLGGPFQEIQTHGRTWYRVPVAE